MAYMVTGVRMTQEEFLARARSFHGNKYDYSETVYVNNRTKVAIGCPTCGQTFHQIAKLHLKYGCNKCKDNALVTQEEFLARARSFHGNKYDYSETVYTNMRTEIAIGCPTCGQTFHQIAKNHLKYGCNKCPKPGPIMSQETFELKAKNAHGELYDYSLTKYIACDLKVVIGCRLHGAFMQQAESHLQGIGCPRCFNKTEKFVFKTLKDSGYDVGECTNIQINKEVKFRYDIVMNINNGIIKVIVEIDGGQHFKWVPTFVTTLEETQQNDMDKQKYAIDNDYHMIRLDQKYVWDQHNKKITEWFDRLSKSLKKIEMQEKLERNERYITDDIDKYSHFVDSQKQSNKCKGQNTLHNYYKTR